MARKSKVRAAEPVLAFRAEVLQQLESCVEGRSPRFRTIDIDMLVHCLELYEHRPWTKAGRQYWWKQLKEVRAHQAACNTVLALLQQAKGRHREAGISAVESLAAALEANIEWLEILLGRGTRPREPWTIMARMIGPLALTALRGADELAGRKPRRGFGNPTGSIVTFVHSRLARIAQQTGEEPPAPETVLDALKAAARTSLNLP